MRTLMGDLDKDLDGVVTVTELKAWLQVQTLKAQSRVEVHEKSLEAAAAEAAAATEASAEAAAGSSGGGAAPDDGGPTVPGTKAGAK